MRNHRINKPIKNYQKKKYYTNRNIQNNKSEAKVIYYYDPQTREWHERNK